jgi:hypothetical protein
MVLKRRGEPVVPIFIGRPPMEITFDLAGPNASARIHDTV